MKRFINRLPLLLFILTLASLALMIAVRIGASGTKLLSAGSGVGRLVAAYYHPSVVVFVIFLVLFMIWVLTFRLKQYHRKKRDIAENEAFTPGEVEYPPSTVLSMEQIEVVEDDAPAASQPETENSEDPEIFEAAAAEQDAAAGTDEPAEGMDEAAFEEETEMKPEAEIPAAFAEEAEIIPDEETPAAFEEEADMISEAETPENLENQD